MEAGAILGLLVLSTQYAYSQNSELQDRLASVQSLNCRFSAVVTSSWADDTPSVSVAGSDLEANFSNIDIAQGTADADSRFGASYIVVRHTPDYLHLIQMIDIGSIYITTVLPKMTQDGRMMAIHVRNRFAASSYPEFRERPQTFIGECEVGGP